MIVRTFAFVLAGVAAAAGAAEPSKPPVRKAEQSTEQRMTVVPASVSGAPQDAEKAPHDSDQKQPAQRRGRETTCRCGDQQPGD